MMFGRYKQCGQTRTVAGDEFQTSWMARILVFIKWTRYFGKEIFIVLETKK